MADNADNIKKKDLAVARVFDAPVEMLWRAWTDPEQAKLWWGPDGFTSGQMLEISKAGLEQCLDKMAESLM